jgi:nicotinate phosphoribosyltransferase
MNLTKDLYGGSLALLTDLYQLTMTYGYWKSGTHNKESVFNLFFRENPFKSGYTVVCGLEYIIDYLKALKFSDSDILYLKTLNGADGKPLFDVAFLDFLKEFEFACDIDAIPEGTVVFPNEPLIRVKGPIYQCQMIETALLNILNFQSLIATKASRINYAAKGDPVLEFGLRRAQGIDGAIAASRAAYIGGCSSTSNVLAGKLFGIPVSGTHAHSWVMSFDTETEAFEVYAKSMPNNCVLLVDTYDTKKGVEHAIKVAQTMKNSGNKLLGIRIDSGDLAYFSIMARKMLDQAGLTEVKVIASNDLDENLISSLKEQEAAIDIWGIGTKLVTAYDQPALGAVYKLAAIKNEIGVWENKIKLSAQSIKINIPGLQKVRRFSIKGAWIADMIYNELHPDKPDYQIIDPADPTRRKAIKATDYTAEELLVPVFVSGMCVYKSEDINTIRNRHFSNVTGLHKSIRRFANPHIYPVGLEADLYQDRMDLILKLKTAK